MPESPSSPQLQIALSDFTRFVRQLSHDLRNHLNAAELQSAFIAEIADDAEVKEEVKRLRAMVSQTGAALQKLTATIAPPKLSEMPYGASDFMEDFRQKVAADFPKQAAEIDWKVALDRDVMLDIDPQLIQSALLELLANAFRHTRGEGLIEVSATLADGAFVLRVREPKAGFTLSTDDWGRAPLRTVGQGHYGLGLYRARTILEAHQGQLEAKYDRSESALITTIRLPLGTADR